MFVEACVALKTVSKRAVSKIIPGVSSYLWTPPGMSQSIKCPQPHGKYQRLHVTAVLRGIIGFIYVTEVVPLKQRCHSWLRAVMPSDFIACCFSLSPSLFQGDC